MMSIAAGKGEIGELAAAAGADRDSLHRMLRQLMGGRSRTLEEFREMAGRAGLEVTAVGRQAGGKVIVESRPR